MISRTIVLLISIFLLFRAASAAAPGTLATGSDESSDLIPSIYLPVVFSPICPQESVNQFTGGTAFQVEFDNPVRLAGAHADKNFELRGYLPSPDPNVHLGFVDYGLNDPTPPPQLATLFSLYRVPEFVEGYQIRDWYWSPSPLPGTPGGPVSSPPVTVLGLASSPGESLRVPLSGYDIGDGVEVIVLYADEDSLALRYAREDSAGTHGFTLHLGNICTDPNLLALYNVLDTADGPRYIYKPPEQRPYTYALPQIPAGQPIGTARGDEIVFGIVDSGSFLDPRSCDDWWQIRPGYGGCP